ncbi:MAG TPA: radical SAM protein [Anaerovoracaceae bacterium]|nr:radical SAM protein [Anaerovoracaceae bacterium]
MKTHAIIPIFIPHLGCPNDCVFCNQKKITAKTAPLSKEDMVNMIEKYLKTISGRGIKTVEIAFYGGSFTGIPIKQQQEYLSIAKVYKDKGLIQKIHLSTRPDYIDDAILTNLKLYDVDIIELGVQSFDEDVLLLSNRGHSRDVVYSSSRLIQDYGFELGLQLMISLPGDTYEKSINSAKEAVKIGPSIARLYPTVIIKDTELYEMYLRGEYTPLSLEDTIRTTKDMYLILTNAGINVIRIGLKSTDLINENGEIAGGYHPAFRQLVESEIAREQMEAQLLPFLSQARVIAFYSNGTSFSNMIGNRKFNRIYFEKKYPHVRFTFHVDSNLPDHVYLLKIPEHATNG